MIKRILVALSGTPFTGAAVQHALELARIHGAEITGVTDIDLARLAMVGPVPLGAEAAANELVGQRIQLTQQHVEEAVAQFEKACADAGTTCAVVRETGSPFAKLVSLWRYHDLTIAGLRGLFEYGVVHNPDDVIVQLITKGVRPILAVAKSFRTVHRVLVAYNGSMESAKALKRFVQLRLWPRVALGIVCFERPSAESEALLSDAAHYCSVHGYEAETMLAEGSPRDRILEHAAGWKADLLVMGATSRVRILRHVLGDTALHVVRHAEIPVFLTS